MKNYYDKQIIPLKVRSSEAESMSLDTGYYIEGRLETFSKDRLDRRLIQLKIEREAVRKETNDASKKRLWTISSTKLLKHVICLVVKVRFQ